MRVARGSSLKHKSTARALLLGMPKPVSFARFGPSPRSSTTLKTQHLIERERSLKIRHIYVNVENGFDHNPTSSRVFISATGSYSLIPTRNDRTPRLGPFCQANSEHRELAWKGIRGHSRRIWQGKVSDSGVPFPYCHLTKFTISPTRMHSASASRRQPTTKHTILFAVSPIAPPGRGGASRR